MSNLNTFKSFFNKTVRKVNMFKQEMNTYVKMTEIDNFTQFKQRYAVYQEIYTNINTVKFSQK